MNELKLFFTQKEDCNIDIDENGRQPRLIITILAQSFKKKKLTVFVKHKNNSYCLLLRCGVYTYSGEESGAEVTSSLVETSKHQAKNSYSMQKTHQCKITILSTKSYIF